MQEYAWTPNIYFWRPLAYKTHSFCLIVMRVVLDIATLLGGLAALWFFWDRLVAFRYSDRRLEHKSSVHIPEDLRGKREQVIPSRSEYLRVLGILSGAISAVLASVLVSWYGFLVPLVSICISFGFSWLGELVAKKFSDTAGRMIFVGGGSNFLVALLGVLMVIPLHYLDIPLQQAAGEPWFIVVSGAIGAVYGFWVVEYAIE